MSSISRNYTSTHLWLALSVLLLAASYSFAQNAEPVNKTALSGGTPATATLNGVVTDENDAVIAGASVSVKDSGRGKSQKEATTGADGSFALTELLPGSYIISVRQQGFSTAEVRDVVISQTQQTALKIRLRAGHIDETVTITAEPAVVKKSQATGLTLERQTLEELPLNGRSLQNAILLAPGTVATRATFAEQGQLSVNGQRANANYFMVDGVSANIGVAVGATGTGQSGAGSLPGLSVMGSMNTLVSVDALQELRVLTSPFAPEYGRTTGAQVLLTTRAGTNQFHGSFFEYFRSNLFGARDWFMPQEQGVAPSTQTHNFGGVFSGPIFKDRTHFFLSYEGLNSRLPQFTTRDVPSLFAREQAVAVLQPLLNAFPRPNGPDNRTNPALASFTAAYTDTARFNAASLRLDHRFNDRMDIFARYNYAPSEIVQRGAGSSLNNPLRLSFKTETLTAGLTHIITPNLINEFRANYSSSNGEKIFELDDLGGASLPNDANLFPSYAARQNSFYSFSLGGNTVIHLGKDATSFQDQLNLVDHLSFNIGAHQLKFGFDYRHLTSIYDEWKYRENAFFNPDILDFQYGYAQSVTLSAQDRTAINFTNLSVYMQDTWQVKRRLSVTYGSRWEYNPAPSGEGSQSLFTVQGLDNPKTLSLAPEGTPLYQTTYNNFAPRLGVAFQLSERPGRETMLRGGFGVFYDLGTGPLGNSASSFPYQRRRIYTSYTYPLDPTINTPLLYTTALPVSVIRVAEPQLKLPRVMQWNIGVEQSLGAKQTISASYVRTSGRRLLRTEQLLEPNPSFRQVYVTTNKAESDYYALQVQFQRRLSRGFQALASYTYAHSTDTASNDSTANLPALSGYDVELDRGPSDFDVRHSVSASVSYDIPSFIRDGIGGALLKNWSLNAIFNARTAVPVEIYSSRFSEFGASNLRPDLVEGEPLYLSDAGAPGGWRINPAAFAIPVELRQGTLGRNALRGFPLVQVDMGIQRRFELTDRVNLQFRIEAFNLFNHPNFGAPVGDFDSNQFGRATSLLGRSLTATNSTGFNPLFQTGGPRAVQFAVKIQF